MLRLDSTTKNTKATLLHSPLLPPTIPEVNWRLKFSSGSTTIFFQQHLCNSLVQTFQGQEDFEECCWLHSIHQLATFKTTRFISHYNFFSWKKNASKEICKWISFASCVVVCFYQKKLFGKFDLSQHKNIHVCTRS